MEGRKETGIKSISHSNQERGRGYKLPRENKWFLGLRNGPSEWGEVRPFV